MIAPTSSLAWDDAPSATAALQLLDLKGGSPSRVECRVAGNFLGELLLREREKGTTDSQQSRRGLPPKLKAKAFSSTSSGRGSARRCPLAGGLLAPTPEGAANAVVPRRGRGKKGGKRADFNVSTSTAFAPVVPVVPVTLPAPLAAAGDAQYLSPAQAYIRQHCVVLFEATATTEARGRQTTVEEGRVGVRCAFCGERPWKERASQSAAFPTSIAKLCSSVVMIQCRHFPVCTEMPDAVREDLARLKNAGSAPPPSKAGIPKAAYWEQSAREVGLVDTKGGIRFVSRGVEPVEEPAVDVIGRALPVAEEPSVDVGRALEDAIARCTMDIAAEGKVAAASTAQLGLPRPNVVSPDFVPIFDIGTLLAGQQLVSPEDRELVPAYLLLAMAQLQPCLLTEEDRVGSYLNHEVGFKGLCCRHCKGRPGVGYGRLFPNSVRSLAQTTTTRTIVKHITSKCQHVPQNIRDTVKALLDQANEDATPAYSPKAAFDDGRPKYGDRRVFFQNVWNRLHGSNGVLSLLAADGPVAAVAFPGPQMIRPTPIRQVAPVASVDAFLRSNGAVPLFDDQNRHVTVTLRGNDAQKRSVTFADSLDSKKKARV